MMNTLLLFLLLLLLAWKGFHAWKRGRGCYVRERKEYVSLWEYRLANGATASEARRPFLRRALRRAVVPLLTQWQFWLVVAALVALILLTL